MMDALFAALLACLNISQVGAVNGVYLQSQIAQACQAVPSPLRKGEARLGANARPGSARFVFVCKCRPL